MATFKLGMNAVMLYTYPAVEDPTTLTPTTMTELTNVRDVTLTLETGEADITTRGNDGWRATAATLKECTAEFEMVYMPSDPGFTAIKNAWLGSNEISLAILVDDPDEIGSEGPCGNFTITNFSRSEPLEEAITVSVTAKLSAFGQWYEKT